MSPKSKYYPLFNYLQQQPDTDLLELSFAEIQAILGRPLPPSAQTMRAWWANASRTAQAISWQEAGWLVDSVDFETQLVIFRPARIAPFGVCRNRRPFPDFHDPFSPWMSLLSR